MPFVKENHYYKQTVNASEVATDIKIGNPVGTKFIPQADMSKWDGEAWLKVWYPIAQSTEDAVYDAPNDRVALTIGDTIFRWYLQSDKYLEFDILLGSKPPGNKNTFTFNIDFPEGLTFHYQDTLENDYAKIVNPPMTLAEFLATHHRPENIVGSYAVHWHKRNGKYRWGKAFHILRPKLTDALGNSTWAALAIDPVAKTLTISTTSSWLRDATYPVTVDPTFGYTDTTGTWGTLGSANDAVTKVTTTSEAGTITKLWTFCRESLGAAATVKLAMYKGTIGATETRIAAPGEFSLTSSEHYPDGAAESIDYSGTLEASTDYWFGQHGSSGGPEFIYDSADSNSAYKDRSYADAFPAAFNSAGAWIYAYAVWCEYTAGGGSSVSGDLRATATLARKTHQYRIMSGDF